jgi:glycosyltransferase involved in cell wall biosynthesis
MNIGINACFWGQGNTGTGQYLHQLVRALRQVSPETGLQLLAPANAALAGHAELQLHPTPVDRLGANAAKLWFEQCTFSRMASRLGCDVAHVPHFAPPLRCRLPLVVTIHDLIPLILPAYRGSPGVRAYTRLVARAARRADVVLTDSHASARDILRILGLGGDRVCVVPLAAHERFYPLDEAEISPVVARYGLARPYLLYLGGFDVRKNVPLLLHAFQQVAAATDLALVVAGRLPTQDRAFAPDPRPIAARLGIADRVRFIGFVPEEDKPALYAGALAFAFPSSYEGFGLPVLEALSCGTPVVVGLGSSLDEVAGPGGLAVDPTDAAELADALLRLAGNPALRQDLAAAGLAHAARFSWRQVAVATLEAYDQARRVRAR